MSSNECAGLQTQYDVFSLDKAETLALLHGCGFSYEELKKPRVAVFNTLNPMNPGHIHQGAIAKAVAEGVREAGGLPVEFNGTNLCDSMLENQKYTLPSRDLLVNDIDLMVSYHRMDALVMIGTCDKVLPALLMAAGRLNLPTVIVTGGYMKPGNYRGENVDFIDIGPNKTRLRDGKITQADFDELVDVSVPGGGACCMMGTGNTMAIITEVIGMSMPGNSSTPGRSQEMQELAKAAGKQVMKLYAKKITARQIITKESITNAIKTCMAIGGSGNTIIHVPAVATESGIEMNFSDIYAAASFEIPLLVGVRPNGPYNMDQYAKAGGTQAILHELRKHLDTNCMSVNEKTIGENISGHEILAPSIIHPLSNPLDNQGGLALMRGNLVPDGTYIKQSAVPECLMKLRGPAHVFNNMDDANNALLNHEIKAGEIVIIRYLGPKASYDSAYWFTSQLKGSLVYKGRKVALYGGAYAPSYLPNDVDTFACGVNCGNHQIHHPPLIVKVHFFPCVQITGNFFDLFRADGIHTQLRYLFDKLLLASVQFFNLAVHIGEQDGICPGQRVNERFNFVLDLREFYLQGGQLWIGLHSIFSPLDGLERF